VADEPGDAEILFSSLEKSSGILIINYSWCVLILILFSLGQVTCTDSQVTAHCSTVSRRVGNQSVPMTIYMHFFFILAILYWTEFRFSICYSIYDFS